MSDDMLKNAIEEIAGMAAPRTYEIDGETWASEHLSLVRAPEDVPTPYTVNTLEGLAAFIKREGIAYARKEEPLFVAVADHDLVKVESSFTCGENTNYLRRGFYLAVSDVPDFATGFQPLEALIIRLRAQCADTEDRARLLELLSTVHLEDGVSTMDNGVTQTVTQRRGVALKQTVDLNDPYVRLQPYRTFLEVEQPESEFLLRVSQEGEVGLFEADGGAWKLEAKRRIRDWLADKLKAEIDAGLVVVTV